VSDDSTTRAPGLRGRAVDLLTRFSRSWFPSALAAFGACAVVTWLLYDAACVGAPYPENAPLDLKLQYDRNVLFSGRIHTIGVSALTVGLMFLVVQLLVRFCLGLGRNGRRRDLPLSD
jgi:hypothetical protein